MLKMLSARIALSKATKNSFRTIYSTVVARKDPTDIVDVPDRSLPIPTYQQKQNETTEIKRARLLYQSRKRGMLENGLLLSTFASRYLDSMNEKQLALYDNLINQISNDWDIYYYATNVKPTPNEHDNEIMDLLKKHVMNDKRENRCRQPDLVFNK